MRKFFYGLGLKTVDISNVVKNKAPEDIWINLWSQYAPEKMEWLYTVARKEKKVLIIGPGFGCLSYPEKLESIKNSGYQVHVAHNNLPNPKGANFDMKTAKKPLLEEIKAYQPDVILCASKGGAYLLELWATKEWEGPSVLNAERPPRLERAKGTRSDKSHFCFGTC